MHPEWGGVAAFLVAFAESVAVIGTVIPGSVTMTAIGILIGAGLIPPVSTLVYAVSGAVVGDAISYGLGYYFKDGLAKMWPFRNNPQWLTHGERFFQRHGGKGILLGRFIGLVRSFIPLIAGMLRMPPWRFFPIDIIAAVLWAPIYMLPGIFIGVASEALPADIASKLIVIILVALVGFWVLVWLVKKLVSLVGARTDLWLNRVWDRMLAKRHWHWCTNFLRDAERPHHHGQLVLGFSALIAAVLFLFIYANIIFHGPMLHLNALMYHLVRSFRAMPLDALMVGVTFVGDKVTLVPAALVVALYFFIIGRRRMAFYWICAFAASGIIGLCLRFIYFSARPPGITVIKASSSFPSGHVLLATTFYGFLAWIACLHRHRIKKTVYGSAAIIIFLVMLSRIYLGEHWLTDVLGSFFLGLVVILIAAILYQRRIEKSPRVWPTLSVGVLSVLIFGLGLGIPRFQSIVVATQPTWIHEVVNTKDWWRDDPVMVPTYRLSRLGYPIEMLNLQWAGQNMIAIRHQLLQHGWLDSDSEAGRVLVKRLEDQHIIYRLNLLPILFKDQKPDLVMIKMVLPNKPPLVIRLWSAHIKLLPENNRLWLGTLSFQHTNEHFFFHNHNQRVASELALKSMISSIDLITWQLTLREPMAIASTHHRGLGLNYSILIRPRYS